MLSTAKTTKREQNATLKNEFILTESLLEEARAAGLDRQVRRLERRLKRIEEEFLVANQQLAQSVTKDIRRAASAADADDYLAEAMVGLWEAWQEWDPEKAAFSSYAKQWMKGRALRAMNAAEASEASYRSFLARPTIQAAREKVVREGGSAYDIEAVASEAGISVERVKLAEKRRSVQLDAPLEFSGDRTFADLISEDSEVADEFSALARGFIENPEVHGVLNPRELWVLVRIHGLDDGPPQEGSRVGKQIGLGRQTISRAAVSASEKLQALPLDEILREEDAD